MPSIPVRLRGLIGSALCLLLAACGPQYGTEYKYFQPKSQSGKECTNHCLIARSNCDMACTLQQQRCYNRARMQDQMDEFLSRGAYWNNGVAMSAYRPMYFPSSTAYAFCRAEVCFGSCLNSYQQCFTECGGKITEETKCVSHCPEPVPAAASQSSR